MTRQVVILDGTGDPTLRRKVFTNRVNWLVFPKALRTLIMLPLNSTTMKLPISSAPV